MTVEVRATHLATAGKPTRFEVRLRDDDASDYITPIPSYPLDQTFIFKHKYQRRGTFKISVEATTTACYTALTGLGKETATARTQVKIR